MASPRHCTVAEANGLGAAPAISDVSMDGPDGRSGWDGRRIDTGQPATDVALCRAADSTNRQSTGPNRCGADDGGAEYPA